MIRSLLQFEFLQLRRNHFLWSAASLFILLSAYAVWNGKGNFDKQSQIVYAIDTAQNNRYNEFLTYYEDVDTLSKEGIREYRLATDPMLADNFLKKHVLIQPNPLSILSIGQSDYQSHYLNIVMRNNVYSNAAEEITNPQKLMAGNIDYAFLILYLLPLIIIGWCYNIISTDKENGTLALLAVYGNSIKQILLIKTIFRYLIIAGFIMVLTCIIALASGIPLTGDLGIFLLVTLLYILFWFSIVYLVASYNVAGRLNAIILACVWTVVLYITPGILNRYLEATTGNLERTDLAISIRDYAGELWDLPKHTIIDSLKASKTQFDWKSYPVTDSSAYRIFSYYELSQMHTNEIGSRDITSRQEAYQNIVGFNLVNPAFALLSTYNDLARTDIGAYNYYTQQAEQLQTNRRHFIYQYLLSGKKFWEADFKQFPNKQVVPKPTYKNIITSNLLFLLIVSLMSGCFGWITSGRRLCIVR